MLKIFPWVLTRIGGESFEIIDSLNCCCDTLQELVISSVEIDNEKELLANSLSDILYFEIGRNIDPIMSKKLINIRRNIFNRKKIGLEITDEEIFLLNPDTVKMINMYSNVYQRDMEIKLQFEDNYVEILSEIRKKLQQIIQSTSVLSKGLVLSSRDLLDDLQKYKDYNTQFFSKRKSQTELGILKFLTRVCCKTSPFSTFTNLSFSQITEKQRIPVIQDKTRKRNSIKSFVRINNILLAYLKSILSSYDDFFIYLKIRLNPTINYSDGKITYLTNHHNIEAFQSIGSSEVLHFLIDKIKSRKKTLRIINLLGILRKASEADEHSAKIYIKKLIDLGLIELDFEVSGTDPLWYKNFRRKLAYFNDKKVEGIDKLISTLGQLSTYAKIFQNANATVRCEILDNAFNDFKDTCRSLHVYANLPKDELVSFDDSNRKIIQETFKKHEVHESLSFTDSEKSKEFVKKSSAKFPFKKEQIFYEDTRCSRSFYFNKKNITSIISTLDKTLHHLKFFSQSALEKEKMHCYFVETYKDNQQISLLKFYQDYYRDVKFLEENSAGIPNQETSKNFHSTFKKKQQFWRSNFQKSFNSLKWTDILNLSLKSVANGDANSKMVTPYSLGAFVQPWIDEDQNMKLVINNTFSGYGKMLSRFLYMFPDKIFDDLKTYNLLMESKGEISAESTDASYFNANIHPPIMPFEIRIPGGHNNYNPENLIDTSNIEIVLMEDKNDLMLVDSVSKKVLKVYDLSFQNTTARSKLFQIFEVFSASSSSSVSPINIVINNFINSKNGEADIIVFPRILLNDQIVIQRKAWQIKYSAFPIKSDESDSLYFLKVNKWRLSLHIPDEVFLLVQEKDKKLKNNSAHKPQYLNFKNPLLVRLLDKAVHKHKTSFMVVEMLPASKDMLRIGEKRFVTEFVIQWYCHE